MANRRPKPEEIVTKLRQVEVLVEQGRNGDRSTQRTEVSSKGE